MTGVRRLPTSAGEIMMLFVFMIGLATIVSIAGGMLLGVVQAILGVSTATVGRLLGSLCIGFVLGVVTMLHAMEGES